VAVRLERLQDRLAEVDAAVVEGDGNVHRYATRARSASARATTLSTV
jgi:hypothetical protein